MKAALSPLTLKFRKKELENKFINSNREHQRKFLLLLCSLQALLVLANTCLGPTQMNLALRVLFPIIIISLLIIFYVLIERFHKTFVEGGICLIIAAVILLSSDYVSRPSTDFSNYLFYFSTKQLQISFLLILRVSWRINFFLIPFLEGYITVWCLRADDISKLNYYPVATYFVNTVTLLAYNYWGEKQTRTIFHEKLIHSQSLEIFKEILNNAIPSSALIVKKKKIIFANIASHSLFGFDSPEEIEAALNKITVIHTDMSFQNVENINLLTDMDLFTTQGATKTMEDYAGNMSIVMNIFSSRDSLNRFEYFSGFFNQEGCPAENFKKPIDIQMGKIIWDEEEAILILINDVSAAQRLKYLKALVAYKDKLLASVSHNLRTPLNGILGTLTLACERIRQNCQVDDNRKGPSLEDNTNILNYLETCIKSATILLYSINDILDYSHITNGKLRLNLEATNITHVINEVLKLVSAQAQEKNLSLEVSNTLLENSLANVLITDGFRLKQILLNLLTNALKFTHEGFIKVEVKEKLNYVKFSVADTGVGIKQEDISKVFKIFGKLDQTERNIDESGVGFGLAVSQNLVKVLTNNRGEIKVKSKIGEGSKFSFRLYVSNSREPEGLSFSEEKEKIGQSFAGVPFVFAHINELNQHTNNKNLQKNILIVDDDNINKMVETNYVKSYGLYRHWTAWNGDEAVKLIESLKKQGIEFDAILMDCNMPIMDGYQASKAIKKKVSDMEINPVKIIAVTANISEADREKCLANGMDYYLTKPINKFELQTILFRACFTK